MTRKELIECLERISKENEDSPWDIPYEIDSLIKIVKNDEIQEEEETFNNNIKDLTQLKLGYMILFKRLEKLKAWNKESPLECPKINIEMLEKYLEKLQEIIKKESKNEQP